MSNHDPGHFVLIGSINFARAIRIKDVYEWCVGLKCVSVEDVFRDGARIWSEFFVSKGKSKKFETHLGPQMPIEDNGSIIALKIA